MKNEKAKKPARKSATEKKRPAPVGGTSGEPVGQWRGRIEGETDVQFFRRAFEWDGAKLAAMGAASWERWKLAGMVLHYGFSWAIKNGAGYADILNRPEMLRAVECLINDPPEIAAAFLNPNPNPAQAAGAANKAGREWILGTFREWYEDFYSPENGLLEIENRDGRENWRYGNVETMRFEMFPACLNLGAQMLRQTWGEFVTVCGLSAFAKWRESLARDKTVAGRGYVQMPTLYECEYSEAQYFDLNTGKCNTPKYGGGGVKAAAVLLNFREYLRKRQGVTGMAQGAADRGGVADGAAAGVHVAGQWAIAHGVTGYNGLRFEFRGEIIQRDEKQDKRWKTIAAVIESTDPQGAAHLGHWRGIFGSAKGGYQLIARYIHPIRGRTGCYHLELEPIKGRRPW